MDDFENNYFIDYFDDLNFSEEVNLDKILPFDSPKLIKPRSNFFNT